MRQGSQPILEMRDLAVQFSTQTGRVYAVNGVSLTLKEGETMALVGESGCGKSVTAMSVLRLLKSPPALVTQGTIFYNGGDLLALPEAEIRSIRGNEISMIFQEPMTSLNPVLTIGQQISEVVSKHRPVDRKEARDRALHMLDMVRIPDVAQRYREYPHQLSGGMRQRVMIAMALACDPKLLIADEPTTALDVTIQAQIMELLLQLKEEMGTAILLITHDLGVVAEAAQRVSVMYAGRIIEEAPVGELFGQARHPYTRGLLASIPRVHNRRTGPARPRRLPEIPGGVPSMVDPPIACQFAARCPLATAQCRESTPPLRPMFPDHSVACWNLEAAA